MPFDFQLDVLPSRQRAMWNQARLAPAGFVLYGGTAIVLRLGHRKSVDFDFFRSAPFAPDELHRSLDFAHDAVLLQSAPNTLTLLLDGDDPVKLSYFGGLTHGQLVSPDAAPPHGIPVASAMDLLAAKLKVILQRAEAKDYLDIAALLEYGTPLAEGLAGAEALFGPEFQAAVSLRALSYFSDGDLPTLPASVQSQLARAAAAVREIPTWTRQSETLGR